MKVLFRVDGDADIGFGHLNRCSVLAKSFIKQGHSVVFVTKWSPGCESFLKCVSVHYDLDNKWPSADLCIVDCYNYRNSYYTKLKQCYARVLFFDDIEFSVPNAVDGVINVQIYAKKNMYPSQVKCFVGGHYFLLRDEFIACNQSQNADHIFVCMGGSDPEQQTLRISTLLSQVSNRLQDVVIGPGHSSNSAVEQLSMLPNVIIHRSPSSIGKIMSQASYAITGAGSLLYELAVVGVPVACLILGNNQHMVAHSFAAKGCVLNLGRFDEIQDEKILYCIQQFDKDTILHQKLAEKSSQLIAGNGADLLAMDIKKWLN